MMKKLLAPHVWKVKVNIYNILVFKQFILNIKPQNDQKIVIKSVPQPHAGTLKLKIKMATALKVRIIWNTF